MNPSKALLHPSVTRWAVISSALLQIAGLLTAIGGASGALAGVFGNKSAEYAGACILGGIVLTQIAGMGRSTVKSIDNPS